MKNEVGQTGKPISIILPCYNHGELLLEALDSLAECDPSLFEAIIVDDGSTEKATLEILAGLEKKYRVIHQENAGLGAARNAGMRASSSKYILPLDADNKIFPQYLSLGADILDKDETISVVYGRRDFFGVVTQGYSQPGKFDLPKLIVDNYIDACALIRRSSLDSCGGFATDLPSQGFEDWDLWLSFAEKGYGFYYLEALCYSYRIRNDSMTSVMMTDENARRNLEYLSKKHASLLREQFVKQYYELKQRREFTPFFIRNLAKRMLGRTKK